MKASKLIATILAIITITFSPLIIISIFFTGACTSIASNLDAIAYLAAFIIYIATMTPAAIFILPLIVLPIVSALIIGRFTHANSKNK